MTHEPLNQLDEQKLNRLHWKMVFTAGMGFFTDAYDLFIIGVVTTLLLPIWHLSLWQLSLLNGASLAAAAFGAILFGYFADRFGRKKMYGIEILILFVGAIASALSPNYNCLLIARMLVGFGIGGDYPTSAVIASEHSNRKNRGFLVLMVFAMQALGLVFGPMLASLLLVVHLPHAWIWRLLLGFGALPAASVYFLRRKIAESPRYLLNKELPFEGGRAVDELAQPDQAIVIAKKPSLFCKPWGKYLIGTAGAWFLLDIVFYGNAVSSSFIMHSINKQGSLLMHTLIACALFLVFAVPGYFLAAKFVDKLGRKLLQMLGFGMIAVCYALIAIPFIQGSMLIFILIFGLSFFFVNFGPNSTTFLIPSEIYPTNIRARAHGFSAATGKIGAFLGAFCLPLFLKTFGLGVTMSALSLLALLGILVTRLLPERMGASLEVAEQFNHFIQDS
jgi:MFS transporter, PHS family, inorganic phosphate transporter